MSNKSEGERVQTERRWMILPKNAAYPNFNEVHREDDWCAKAGCVPVSDSCVVAGKSAEGERVVQEAPTPTQLDQPQQFTKKPVTIWAMRFAEDGSNWVKIHQFMRRQCPVNATTFYVDIPTLEGTMQAKRGDWIIKGVKGEFYPCKPDIFETTYGVAQTTLREAATPTIPSLEELEREGDDWKTAVADSGVLREAATLREAMLNRAEDYMKPMMKDHKFSGETLALELRALADSSALQPPPDSLRSSGNK